MRVVKKLLFAPLFLISLVWLFYQLSPLLKSSDLIFSFSLAILIKLILISVGLFLSGLFFTIFSALASDLKLVIPVILVSCLIPFIYIPTTLAIIYSTLLLASLLAGFMGVENTMKSYLSFSPTVLLCPSIKQLITLLVFGLSILYFLSINQEIKTNGFQLPDSLIDSALKFMPQTAQNSDLSNTQTSTGTSQMPQISQDQINLAKQNPALLKQFGIDPKMLDSIGAVPSIGSDINNVIKSTVKDQLQNIIKPYQSFIPIILSLLFYFSFQTFLAILFIFLSPLVWLIFLILEKSSFITFTEEMRPVRKMVV